MPPLVVVPAFLTSRSHSRVETMRSERHDARTVPNSGGARKPLHARSCQPFALHSTPSYSRMCATMRRTFEPRFRSGQETRRRRVLTVAPSCSQCQTRCCLLKERVQNGRQWSYPRDPDHPVPEEPGKESGGRRMRRFSWFNAPR